VIFVLSVGAGIMAAVFQGEVSYSYLIKYMSVLNVPQCKDLMNCKNNYCSLSSNFKRFVDSWSILEIISFVFLSNLG
jgi:hypothetical protein